MRKFKRTLADEHQRVYLNMEQATPTEEFKAIEQFNDNEYREERYQNKLTTLKYTAYIGVLVLVAFVVWYVLEKINITL